MKITGRSSSITNAFINSIIPVIHPSDSEIEQALSILRMDKSTYQCAYCGDAATEWDHLRPLVLNQRPTGYISEIANLVPACGKCNQSKGNKKWSAWIISSATLSPKTKGVLDLDERIEKLSRYELILKPTHVNFENIVGEERWEEHWKNWTKVLDTMEHAQNLATKINKQIAEAHNK